MQNHRFVCVFDIFMQSNCILVFNFDVFFIFVFPTIVFNAIWDSAPLLPLELKDESSSQENNVNLSSAEGKVTPVFCLGVNL